MTAATLDGGMEELIGDGSDVGLTQIVLVFHAGGNCVRDTALMTASQLVRRRTPGRMPDGGTLQSTKGRMG